MPNYSYYQVTGGEEKWHGVPIEALDKVISQEKPMFVTALAVSKLVEGLEHEDILTLSYAGPLYLDWDSKDEALVIQKVNQFLDKLEEMKVELNQCLLYATGGRGYHLEIPMKLFLPRAAPKGIVALPGVYREMALELAVDTLDLKIYSAKRGRMWRRPNVQRENGRYKVQITVEEMRNMTPELCLELTAQPRESWAPANGHLNSALSAMFCAAQQKIDEIIKRRKKFKPDPAAVDRANCTSIQLAMMGIGLKDGVGFQELATQLAVCATTSGLNEDQFVEACQGLVESHQSDSSRYNSESKRRDELRRMHRYMLGNDYWEFGIGAVKVLLNHTAPDLDGIPVTDEQVKAHIEQVKESNAAALEEYADVAKGIEMHANGIYKATEHGPKRVCAIAFQDTHVLFGGEQTTICGYNTKVLVNGQPAGELCLETDIFLSLNNFNRFAVRYGHAFLGNDQDVRMAMMRFVEQGKQSTRKIYTVCREGLDLVSIPMHPDPTFREHFLVWADAGGVVIPEFAQQLGLELQYLGYPDPRGVFKTDISRAPALVPWLAEADNKDRLRALLRSLMTCQKPELLGKLIGWYIACFWKPLFQKAYQKFPLLHVNGPAGVGKTEMNVLLNNFFYYEGRVRTLSPSSTTFSMNQHLTASSSIPLVIDEYKPEEMRGDLHGRLKLMLRDAYNQRSVSRGGGTRESDDYRTLQQSELAAPIVFIAEAAETESAVMERVVLATFSRPPAATGLRWQALYQSVANNAEYLGILGQWMAANVIRNWTLERLKSEFDEIYQAARKKYMLSAEDLAAGLPEDELRTKSGAKERSVYNHSVAQFGFRQFRLMVNQAVGVELDPLMEELESLVFSRLSDLSQATKPEYVKVLAEIARITWAVEAERPGAIRHGQEYFLREDGKIEMDLRSCYLNYRRFCKDSGVDALYKSAEPFMYAVRESPAFIRSGVGEHLKSPNIYTFDISELTRLEVDLFKNK